MGLLLKVGEDGFGGLAVGEGGGVDAGGGDLGVKRFALLVEFFQRAAGVGGLEQGALAVLDALVELVGVGVEPDNGADLREKFPVLPDGDDASAGGDDETDAADEALEDFCFECAEMVLAVLFENGGDGLPGLLRNEGVRIDEREPGKG